MSAIGAALARGVTSLGGPQVATVLVVSGLVVGSLGGAYVGSGGGGSQPASATGELAVYPCPEQGPALLSITRGQKVLATGRTADGAWYRIHYPSPGRTEAWVQADPLTVSGAAESLPVAECAPEFANGSPDVAPDPSLSAILNLSPSPPPTPTPAPSANPRPTLTALSASTTKISYDTGDYCPDAVTRVTFSVKAKDETGLDSVVLRWRKPGSSSFAATAMTRTAGSATNGTWKVTLDTTADAIRTDGTLAYYAVGTDVDGGTRRIPRSGSDPVAVEVCVNTGPSFSSLDSSAGSTLFWDPLGVGRCQTATNITATVRDVDGVDSVRLYYRRPGDASYSSKPMENTSGNRWFANLDTLGDKIPIVGPPTDTLRWYLRAEDKEGLTSQTRTRSITIKRCDTEAEFDGVFPTSEVYACTTSARITIGTYANDEDQNGNGLKVVFHWELMNPRTGAGPISGKMTASVSQGNYYEGRTATFNGQTYYSGRLTVYAVTTDRYNGSTKSPVDQYLLACQ